MAEKQTTAKERVVMEAQELEEKMSKLDNFLCSDIFKKLKPEMQNLLKKQLGAMEEYRTILYERLAIWDD